MKLLTGWPQVEQSAGSDSIGGRPRSFGLSRLHISKRSGVVLRICRLLGVAGGFAIEVINQRLNGLDSRVLAVAVYQLARQGGGYTSFFCDALPARWPFGSKTLNDGLKDAAHG